MTSDWEAAEERLQTRSAARQQRRAREDRRRRLLPWLVCLIPLPAAGAAAFLWFLRSSGGDLRGDSPGTALLALAGSALVPAALAGWVGRHHGPVDAVLWALVAAAVELALVFGVGFALLGLGPKP